ncbi:MAG TPA: hypothetical protein VLQ45_03780 [Thermoanaerobaculia bacterium]|nr:hypothetical protein [Thermoanaerobaculia bacterium]
MRVTLVEFGALKAGAAYNACDIANQVQGAFEFVWHPEPLRFDKEKYLLPNGGYDLCRAAKEQAGLKDLPKPLILLSSLPFSIADYAEDEDGFFFSQQVSYAEQGATIVSTNLWEKMPGKRRLQPYFLTMLAGLALRHISKLAYHEETRGCFFDLCDQAADFDRMFTTEGICDECEGQLEAKMRKGQIRVEQLASIKRLFNRGIGRKVCFMAMPFEESLLNIYALIANVFRQKKWEIIRADEIARPRRITDRILLAILTSDLVLADLTSSNPNVFYELGLAHAVGADVILLTQESEVPFDVAAEHTIFYKATEPELKKLEKRVAGFAGRGEP